jgi:plasmid stability protein
LFDESDRSPQTSQVTTTLDLPDDLIDDIHLRAEREGRGLEETVEEPLRAGLSASSSRTSALRAADRDAAEACELSLAIPKGERLRVIERLRDLRLGVTLDGEDIRGPIEQGRRS